MVPPCGSRNGRVLLSIPIRLHFHNGEQDDTAGIKSGPRRWRPTEQPSHDVLFINYIITKSELKQNSSLSPESRRRHRRPRNRASQRRCLFTAKPVTAWQIIYCEVTCVYINIIRSQEVHSERHRSAVHSHDSNRTSRALRPAGVACIFENDVRQLQPTFPFLREIFWSGPTCIKSNAMRWKRTWIDKWSLRCSRTKFRKNERHFCDVGFVTVLPPCAWDTDHKSSRRNGYDDANECLNKFSLFFYKIKTLLEV